MTSAEPILLSVIIVNYETPEHTLQCLRSIREHRPACRYEVLVIDNGSRDGSLARIREEAPEAVCIETGANLGFSRANNLGVLNSRGSMVLLLNSDTVVLDDGLDRLVEYLLARPEVGAVGPRQLDGTGKLQLSWGHFPTLVSEWHRQVLHQRLSVNDLKIRDYLEEKYAGSSEVGWVSGSCLLARRQALVDAGFLDGKFFMYFEDIDLCERIRRKGWKIHFNTDITILHHGGVTAKKNLLHVLVEYRRSQLYFTHKYYRRAGVWVLKALLLAKYGANLIRWSVAFAGTKLTGRPDRDCFARMLLCKKTVELVFESRDVTGAAEAAP